ncbi:MAG: hypothetical protein ACFE95_09580 [Candidatus Hodarchaeota archaeon]
MKIAFLIGRIYDMLLDIPILILPDFTTTDLNITKPKPIILFQISGIYLVIIGYFLLIASQDA